MGDGSPWSAKTWALASALSTDGSKNLNRRERFFCPRQPTIISSRPGTLKSSTVKSNCQVKSAYGTNRKVLTVRSLCVTDISLSSPEGGEIWQSQMTVQNG